MPIVRHRQIGFEDCCLADLSRRVKKCTDMCLMGGRAFELGRRFVQPSMPKDAAVGCLR